ncbi:methylated-DNA--[protein]-cysteine S-methyltransferase [Microlunatus parietis]|uniref:Methylated-DNA--protein-cysteine methyltransferase n=1 Tax=Microlunatus parietis TaxID=682979 RepID=A0A7Y9LDL4_9ACTN|nr:methylated-DNA--[protein]-cysteine S-methyltransferase [Microlunatus parietis]NYE74027.1 methylated-DNA-[protein]-cysteine S-methyltransferase [Microlunatus parietis]
MTVRHTRVGTGIGELTLVAAGDALTGIYFPGHWHPPVPGTTGEYVDAAGDALFTETVTQLEDYLAGRRTGFDLPTATRGDAFSERVWALLRAIPYGETTSYGELAGQLGDPKLARMVGRAVGHNPLSIVVPCHRVLGKDGRLTGYAGGLERKQRLLELEQPVPAAAGRLI